MGEGFYSQLDWWEKGRNKGRKRTGRENMWELQYEI